MSSINHRSTSHNHRFSQYAFTDLNVITTIAATATHETLL